MKRYQSFSSYSPSSTPTTTTNHITNNVTPTTPTTATGQSNIDQDKYNYQRYAGTNKRQRNHDQQYEHTKETNNNVRKLNDDSTLLVPTLDDNHYESSAATLLLSINNDTVLSNSSKSTSKKTVAILPNSRCTNNNSVIQIKRRQNNTNTNINNYKKKDRPSTAQPRPKIFVPPKGIGPIYDINNHDVLCGRGGKVNAHPGNIYFRQLVSNKKCDYLNSTTEKLEKAHIAADIVYHIRCLQPPGRFLQQDNSTTASSSGNTAWFDIGDAKAIKKVGQALREDAPEIRYGSLFDRNH